MRLVIALCAALTAAPASAEFQADADVDTTAFVEANLLGIFYHEFGHALIDILGLPIFGQEEDAADVASIFLIDAFFDEDSAVSMAYDTAFGFLGEAEEVGDDVAWWDVHGPDLQRYYNLVCLFYGANPDEREDVAQDLGLPEERADYCPEEYDQAAASWGGAFDEIAGSGASIRLAGTSGSSAGAGFTAEVIATEIAALNSEFELPARLDVRVEPCGEANAFYDPSDQSITLCTEFADFLAAMAQQSL